MHMLFFFQADFIKEFKCQKWALKFETIKFNVDSPEVELKYHWYTSPVNLIFQTLICSRWKRGNHLQQDYLNFILHCILITAYPIYKGVSKTDLYFKSGTFCHPLICGLCRWEPIYLPYPLLFRMLISHFIRQCGPTVDHIELVFQEIYPYLTAQRD